MIGVLALCGALVFALLFLLAWTIEQHIGDAERLGDAAFRSATGKPARPIEPPARHGPMPYGNLGAWFGDDAYPPDAIRRGEQGRAVARLQIDDAGHPSSCKIEISSGSAALDAATCRVAMSHAEFLPAKDKAGNPIASSWPLPVRWVLPQEAPR